MAATVSTIVSTSVVDSTTGTASTPPNSLNRQAFPSMTGREAVGPMFPRPSTAVPSDTTATTRGTHVKRCASSGSAAMALETRATPGVYVSARSAIESIDRVGVTQILPPSCTANAGSSANRSAVCAGPAPGRPVSLPLMDTAA